VFWDNVRCEDGAGHWEHHSINSGFSPDFIGNLKIGTRFVKEGFLGFNYLSG
jgi:hypothetical protein